MAAVIRATATESSERVSGSSVKCKSYAGVGSGLLAHVTVARQRSSSSQHLICYACFV
jgi:hypothetical protein